RASPLPQPPGPHGGPARTAHCAGLRRSPGPPVTSRRNLEALVCLRDARGGPMSVIRPEITVLARVRAGMRSLGPSETRVAEVILARPVDVVDWSGEDDLG